MQLIIPDFGTKPTYPDDVLDNPPDNWLTDPLVSRVFLVKEKIYAYIVVPHSQSNEWSIGEVGLIRDGGLTGTEFWYSTINGRGFDGKRLMLPVQGDASFYNPQRQVRAIKGKMCDLIALKKSIDRRVQALTTRMKHLSHLADIQDIIE